VASSRIQKSGLMDRTAGSPRRRQQLDIARYAASFTSGARPKQRRMAAEEANRGVDCATSLRRTGSISRP
jgi:hypothetical protein